MLILSKNLVSEKISVSVHGDVADGSDGGNGDNGDGGDGDDGGDDGDGGGDHTQACLRRHEYIRIHISLGIAVGSLRIHTVYT